MLPFGLDGKSGKWTAGYDTRNAPGNGFSHPDNKANLVARWLLAMSDATGKPVYRERAERWFKLMKSRMKLKPDGKYQIWNYWQPAGPWDYKPNWRDQALGGRASQPRLLPDRRGCHRRRLRARAGVQPGGHRSSHRHRTGREAVLGLRSRPTRAEIQKKLEQNMKPDSWGGLSGAPHYLMLQARLRKGDPTK